jgi:hypothetical protein
VKEQEADVAITARTDFLTWVQRRIKDERGVFVDRETLAAVLRAERDWHDRRRIAATDDRLPIS